MNDQDYNEIAVKVKRDARLRCKPCGNADATGDPLAAVGCGDCSGLSLHFCADSITSSLQRVDS